MPNLPTFTQNPTGEAQHLAADVTSSHQSMTDWWLHARRVVFWAAVVAIASFVPYVAALAWYLAAGFSPPPPTITRVLASVSIYIGAPALAVLVASLASQSRPTRTVSARLATVFMLSYAALALLSRIVQLLVVLGLQRWPARAEAPAPRHQSHAQQ